MPRLPRVRDFQREVPKVSKVAGAVLEPLQLSLDELAPNLVHAWDGIRPTDYGYIATCACGWHSREVAEKHTARYEMRAHIGRTPQGTAALRTLRRLGRSPNGS